MADYILSITEDELESVREKWKTAEVLVHL